MYTKVPHAVAAGAGGATALPATGGSGLGWAVIGALCVLVGLFALLMASGALWRVVPAGWRRRSR